MLGALETESCVRTRGIVVLLMLWRREALIDSAVAQKKGVAYGVRPRNGEA